MKKLSDAMSNIADKERIRENVLNSKKNSIFNIKYLSIATVGFAMLFMFVINSNIDNKMNERYVVIDINPSVEIEIDSEDLVISVKALNNDADILLEGLMFDGLNVIEASKLIIDEATILGYIDETSDDNMVLVTHIGQEDDSELQDELEEELEDHFDDNELVVEVFSQGITDEIKTKASELDISNGKMLFITKIASKKIDIPLEVLAQMSIKDINKAIKANSKKLSLEEKAMLNTQKEERKYEQKMHVEEKKMKKQAEENDEDSETDDDDSKKGNENSNNGKNNKGNSKKDKNDSDDDDDDYDDDDYDNDEPDEDESDEDDYDEDDDDDYDDDDEDDDDEDDEDDDSKNENKGNSNNKSKGN